MSSNLHGYEILEIIHEGIKTCVVRAKRQSDGLVVIIKYLWEDAMEDGGELGLQEEYQLLQTIDSEYVIRPIDYFSTPLAAAIVLEYFESRALDQFIKEEPWNLLQRIQIAVQIAEGLGEMHQKNIMHKDVKPQNILINKEHVVKIIDFSNGTAISREAAQEISVKRLEGTLAYISPEQTGRMARQVDYRTDIYSFGITLYQLFTGKLPFEALTPMELIHQHITQLPVPPCDVNPEIPKVLSDVILKCMEKNVEDRYKSAFGLLIDLQRCYSELHKEGKISEFIPGQKDFYDRFHTPQKLYGREKEIAIVEECIRKIEGGELHLLELSGYAGIGKSSLVMEVIKQSIQKNIRFASYKFDQLNKNIPNDAIASIIRILVHQMLSQSTEQLTEWKTSILDAVGTNGKILTDLVADVELVIGEQPSIESLSPVESENRFNYVMNEFIKVLPKQEAPLVLFFDDFQWIDEASLKFFQYMLTNSSIKHLLIIIAYRANEINQMHPLWVLLKEFSEGGLAITHLALTPLEEATVEEIINEVFYPMIPTQLKYLSRTVKEKTRGNPFFVIQLLKYLYDKEFVTFSPTALHWSLDIDAISSLAVSDNVSDFLIEKIKTIDPELLEFMKVCSLLGNSFNSKVLTSFWKRTEYLSFELLKKALQEDFIVESIAGENAPDKSMYHFAHDRLQQVFYDLIDTNERPKLHYELGVHLLNFYKKEDQEDSFVYIVNHLNYGLKLDLNEEQKKEILKLNYQAAIKAKDTQAMHAAIGYFSNVVKLLKEDTWETDHAFTFTLTEKYAECLHYIGEVKRAEEYFNLCLEKSRNVQEKIEIYIKLMHIGIQVGAFDQVFDLLKKAFDSLDYKFNFNPSKTLILYRILYYKITRSHIDMEGLKNLPVITDEYWKLVTAVFTPLMIAAYKGARRLVVLNALMVLWQITTRHGLSAAGIQGIFGLGVILGSEKMADYSDGIQVGRVANVLLQKFPFLSGSGLSRFAYANFSARWELALKHLPALFQESFRECMFQGNIGTAMTALYCMAQEKLLAGAPVDSVAKDTEEYGLEAKKLSAIAEDKCLSIYREIARCLTGENPNRTEPIPEEFRGELGSTDEMIVHPLHLGHYHMWRTILLYYFDEYENAKERADIALQIMENYAGLHSTSMLLLTSCLAIAALMKNKQDDPKGWKTIQSFYKILKKMGEAISINYGPHMWIVAGEMERLAGRDQEALDYYQKAIQTSCEQENPLLSGIAYEVVARFYIQKEDEELTVFYLDKALHCYQVLHADAKVNHMQNRYAPYFAKNKLVESIEIEKETMTISGSHHSSVHSSHTTHTGADEGNVGLSTVIQASQSISKEIERDKLAEMLMKLMIASAGATKAILIRAVDGMPMVYSEITSDVPYEGLKNPISIEQKNKELCLNIVKYVIKTKSQVLVNDVEKDEGSFQNDPYFLWARPKSILCFPLLQQSELKGILYLENTHVSNAFLPSHLQLLSILSSQMVISLENAEFYGKLEEKVKERTQELKEKNEELVENNTQLQSAFKHIQEVQTKMIQQEKMASLGMLTAGIAHELKNPLNFVINFSQIAKENLQSLFEAIKTSDKEERAALVVELQDNLKTIDLQGARANKIIKDMLSHVRERSEAQEEIRVNELIEEAIKLAYHAFKKKVKELRPVQFEKSLEANLPVIRGYPGELIRVFINIVDNGCFALYERQKEEGEDYVPVITISTKVKDGHVIITLRDNGTGIPQNLIDKIYNPFFTTKDAGTGTGLGLWISYDIVTKKHGGSLSVHSEPLSFTEFEITLPI